MLLNLILSNLSIVISSQDYRYIYYTHIYLKTLFPNVIYKFTIHQKREAANQKTSNIYIYIYDLHVNVYVIRNVVINTRNSIMI